MFASAVRKSGQKLVSGFNIQNIGRYQFRVISSSCNKVYAQASISVQPCRFHQTVVNNETQQKSENSAGGLRKTFFRYMRRGLVVKNLYAGVADKIDYVQIFVSCKMPDTYQSWFNIISLHMWMILVRLKQEGDIGRTLSRHVIEVMWNDMEERLRLLDVIDTSEKREAMEEYCQQFFGSIIAYDEGLMRDDKVLASALWRNLFHLRKDIDAESLLLMVEYVRKQTQYLEQQDSETILDSGEIKWLPLHTEKTS